FLLGITIGRNAAAIAANWGANFWAGGALTLSVLPVVGAAMVGSLFSMDAWNNVGFASGELTNLEKDVPFAMGAGVLIVTTLYVLANVSYLVVLPQDADRKSTRLNSSHVAISYAVFCLKKKKKKQ